MMTHRLKTHSFKYVYLCIKNAFTIKLEKMFGHFLSPQIVSQHFFDLMTLSVVFLRDFSIYNLQTKVMIFHLFDRSVCCALTKGLLQTESNC